MCCYCMDELEFVYVLSSKVTTNRDSIFKLHASYTDKVEIEKQTIIPNLIDYSSPFLYISNTLSLN